MAKSSYHRWHKTTFGLLLVGYWFKASKSNSTWWVKANDHEATAPNGSLPQRWYDGDTVWIDLSNSLYREHVRKTGQAD